MVLPVDGVLGGPQSVIPPGRLGMRILGAQRESRARHHDSPEHGRSLFEPLLGGPKFQASWFGPQMANGQIRGLCGTLQESRYLATFR